MFKKIQKEIEEFKFHTIDRLKLIEGIVGSTRGKTNDILFKLNGLPSLDKAQKTIESQQRTIEQLTNALRDKYEHGLFIVSEDGRIPMVIRNGKKVTNELTSYFSIDWNIGEIPAITIEQHAATYYDMEV